MKPTKKEITAIVLFELAVKMKLEPKLRTRMMRIFAGIGKDIENVYSKTGHLPDLDVYTDKIRKTLVNHYKLVSTKFKDHFRKRHDVTNEDKQKIDDDIDDYIDYASTLQSGRISATTKTEVAAIVISLIDTMMKDTGSIDQEKLAKQIRRNFSKRSRPRSDVIAISETQSIAEKTKWTESDVIDNGTGDIDGEPSSKVVHKKQWSAILDKRTRPAHAEADGQIANVGELFDVGGEKLMYPGDIERGSAWNIVNCRCTLIYFSV